MRNKIFILLTTLILVTGCSVTDSSSSLVSSSSQTPVSSSMPSSASSSPSSSVSSSSSSSVNVQGIASYLFDKISELPDLYEYLPAFLESETYVSGIDGSTLDFYSGAVAKTSLPTIYFGAQLNQLRTHVGYTDEFTGGLSVVMDAAVNLGTLYQTYLAENPSQPFMWSKEISGLTFFVTGTINQLIVKVTYGDMKITFAVMTIDSVLTYYVDIYVHAGKQVMLYSTPTSLVVAGKISINSVVTAYELILQKSGTIVTGQCYDKIGVDELALKNYIVFKSVNNIFTVAGEKGDFLLSSTAKCNVENYDMTTGTYLGSEVLEDQATTTYNSLWYPMTGIRGWENIHFELDDDDDKEFPQIYLDGVATEFFVEYKTLFTVKTSRKYDIELKKTYSYINDGEGGLIKKEYVLPFFFIQEDCIETAKPFGNANANNTNIAFAHTLTTVQKQAILDNYETMVATQQAFKEMDVDMDIDVFLSIVSH